ncbi:ATP-binding protein [Flavicella sp.]|uniref:ATP-binding protein n=1 Tax=Flavicella sp. TaxID=2957742 RepID=UPI003015EDB9
MPEKIIITGGPSTGKSSLINNLKNKGFRCMDEISRAVILEARKKGIEHLFISSPILFSEILLEKRIEQFKLAEKEIQGPVFFDRGIIDIIAYLNFSKTKHSIDFNSLLKNIRYNQVFICPPWEIIHKTDNERYESFEDAKKTHNQLLESYRKEGYSVIEIPAGTIDERTEFIINKAS